MIIKNDIFELEISEGIGVYFGSKVSGQHFKKWEDFKEEEKQQIKLIQDSVENLLKTSEKTFLTHPNKWPEQGISSFYIKNRSILKKGRALKKSPALFCVVMGTKKKVQFKQRNHFGFIIFMVRIIGYNR